MLTIDELVDQMKRKVEVAYKTGARHATEIFEDDQAKRVCGNCKHWSEEWPEPDRGECCEVHYAIVTPADFGCNRFEPKDGD